MQILLGYKKNVSLWRLAGTGWVRRAEDHVWWRELGKAYMSNNGRSMAVDDDDDDDDDD